MRAPKTSSASTTTLLSLAVGVIFAACANVYDTNELDFGDGTDEASATPTRYCDTSSIPGVFDECATNADCLGETLRCHPDFSLCVQPCSTDEQCADGASCVSDESIVEAPLKMCVVPVNPQVSCVSNEDCQTGELCANDDLCHKQCTTSDECLRNCVDFQPESD